jgi:hypothetical protein
MFFVHITSSRLPAQPVSLSPAETDGKRETFVGGQLRKQSSRSRASLVVCRASEVEAVVLCLELQGATMELSYVLFM